MDPFEVSSDLVVHNEKLLIGGIWCIIKIDYIGLDHDDEDNEQEDLNDDIFDNQKRKKKVKAKRTRYQSPLRICSMFQTRGWNSSLLR